MMDAASWCLLKLPSPDFQLSVTTTISCRLVDKVFESRRNPGNVGSAPKDQQVPSANSTIAKIFTIIETLDSPAPAQ